MHLKAKVFVFSCECPPPIQDWDQAEKQVFFFFFFVYIIHIAGSAGKIQQMGCTEFNRWTHFCKPPLPIHGWIWLVPAELAFLIHAKLEIELPSLGGQIVLTQLLGFPFFGGRGWGIPAGAP